MNKAPIRRKPPPPPYPRPVPQFEIDELEPAPVDLAWDAVNGGRYYLDEHDAQHAAKRRRIEACAKAYMRGEPVYIISAQLKGPFENGWKNPWAKKKRPGDMDVSRIGNVTVEIPETERKITSSVDDEEATKMHEHTPKPRHVPRANIPKRHAMKSPAMEKAPSPFTTKIHDLTGEGSPKVPRKAKERRVQEWLRVSDDFARKSEVLVHSSPTPVRRRLKTPGFGSDEQMLPRASQSEPPKIASPRVRSPQSSLSLQNHGRDELLEAANRIQKLSKDMQAIVEEPVVAIPQNLQDEVGRLVCPPPKAIDSYDRAEFAILKAKQRVLQTVPAIAHMSPFEFRQAAEGTRATEKNETSSPNHNRTKDTDTRALPTIQQTSDDVCIVDAVDLMKGMENRVAETFNEDARAVEEEVYATAPQPDNCEKATLTHVQEVNVLPVIEAPAIKEVKAPLPGTDAPRPALSTFVSEISTTDMPPSAQPRPEPIQLVSSLSRDDKMISIKQIPSTSEQDIHNGEGEKQEGPLDQGSIAAETPLSSSKAKHQQDNQLLTDASTPKPPINSRELSTQEMLANIEPFEMSTVKKVTGTAQKAMPNTATKSKSRPEKRKRTSFAIDHLSTPSFGSIKDVMGGKISKKLTSPPSFLLGKDDLDLNVSDEENGSPNKKSRTASGVNRPKGILRSANMASTPASLRKTKSGTSIVSAQEGQNHIEEEKFDLDAAIDDLGSFLGTWDAEKEASSLDIEL